MDYSVESSSNIKKSDVVEEMLQRISHFFFLASFGLLPLIFLPIPYAPFEYTKTFIVIICVTVAVIFYSLSVLRSGVLQTHLSWPLVFFGLITLVTIVSALLSGDKYDSFIGDLFTVQTAFFTLLLFVIMVLTAFLLQSKALVMRLYIMLMGSAVILSVLQILRIAFSGKFLGLGVLSGLTDNLLGSFNDLALFFGLVILLSVVALEQLSLTKSGRMMFSMVVALSLAMLAIVNFFAVWMILGLVSLVVLMYSLTKDHFAKPIIEDAAIRQTNSTTNVSSALVSVVVFIFSILFIIGGSATGGLVSKVTGVSYVEVRPSVEATVGIAKEVYKTDAVLGVGPDRFADAWRLHKDSSLNQTIFWSTDFANGSGYIPTQFINNGLLGGILWLIFLALFFIGGIRLLFKTSPGDRVWYFIATSSFVAASFLWLMSLIYNPGTVMMLLTALFTGLVFVAQSHLHTIKRYTVSVTQSRPAGFALVGVVMIVIIVSVSTLYYTGRHYTASLIFAAAVSGQDGSSTLEQVEQKIASAYALVPSDTFARQIALYEMQKMNALLTKQSPTAEEQQEFNKAAVNGINAAAQSISQDPSNPINHTTRGAILSILAAAGVDQAKDTATEAFSAAAALDPNNPSYLLFEAQLAARINDSAGARQKIDEAIKLKPNYTDALAFLSQLDIADGKVVDAIATTRSIISIEPNNPARQYQLGLLLSSNKQLDEAVVALERAVALDANYANARYFLALGYLEQGKKDQAISELEKVAALNPNNSQVNTLIDDIKSGKATEVPLSDTIPTENNPNTVVKQDDGSVTTTESPDTPLITPVNPIATPEDSSNTNQ